MSVRAGFLLVAACAARAPVAEAPDYRPITATPAPLQAALYTDCLADAIANHRYARATDPSTTLLLFTCSGAPARAFYDGLAIWSARIGSQFESGGRTYRSTSRVRHDLFGVDYCATDHAMYECAITLNAGAFLQ